MVAGTDSGQPAASTALRPMLRPWLPTCMTQPMITSSIERGVEVVALDEGLEHLGGEVGRVPARQLPVALAAGGADGVDDDGGGHGVAPRSSLRT